jgi:hypothetical protein
MIAVSALERKSEFMMENVSNGVNPWSNGLFKIHT